MGNENSKSIQINPGSQRSDPRGNENTSRKRKAVIIGINYYNQGSRSLRGCVNDANHMALFLHRYAAYSWSDMVVLSDDHQSQRNEGYPNTWPTRNNILMAMHWLVKDAQPGDELFFHYSGHGAFIEDLDGDEVNGVDELICPVNMDPGMPRRGVITDDMIHEIMVKPLKAGVKLTALFDSCFSGSVMDLPYMYHHTGKQKIAHPILDIMVFLFWMSYCYALGNLTLFPVIYASILQRIKTRGVEERNMRTKFSPADVVMFSGCRDDQMSSDTIENRQNTGVLTWAFLQYLSNHPTATYKELLNGIRNLCFQHGYTQIPQLSCSHPLDTNLQAFEGIIDILHEGY
ncbi:peptidase C14, caspase domain-containing protein [Pyronema omphalodes]|nr:peptidase C14, caspase domain-containing protein [Pyronema omphalodes]